MRNEQQYRNLLAQVMREGKDRTDRTGTGTRSIFGAQLRFDLRENFPLITSKKVHFKSIVHELLWMISGSTNIEYLQENGVTIWDEWADEDGNLGPVYGRQWRNFGKGFDRDDYGVDQLAQAIETIKTNPDSRRIIVTAWNPHELDEMALPPCHMIFQFYVSDGELSCHLNMRSSDTFLGLPFNIAQYALLTHMVAQVTGLKAGELIVSLGDAHIYKNHFAQVMELLSRTPFEGPQLKLNPDITDIDAFKYEDVQLVGYRAHPAIKAEVSV